MKTMFFSPGYRAVTRFVVFVLVCTMLLPGGAVWAGGQQPLHKIPAPVPRTQAELPQFPELALYVKDVPSAIALGKAFFWDMQAGSDGRTACASCHYKAGADPLSVRSRNQLHPGPDGVFQVQPAAASTLTGTDFPFFQVNPPTGRLRIDPLTGLPQDPLTTITRNFNDVAGSQGVLKTAFTGINAGNPVDGGTLVTDQTFSASGQNVRQVTGRNSPSVVNAVFNYATLWDGRGNNIFNGVTPFGPADQDARIYTNVTGSLTARQIAIPNASLASQAVGPPLDDVQMSYAGRTFPELGRKMLGLPRPLNLQVVHPADSVLGALSRSPGAGLNTSYRAMIEDAFANNLWENNSQTVPLNTVGGVVQFDQIEANFSLFWGLSIMLYEATLVSDWTPFDRFQGGNLNALSVSADSGLTTFDSKCAVCHSGSELSDAVIGASAAAIPNCALRACNPLSFTTNTNHRLIELDQTLVIGGLSDLGFANLGLRPMTEDAGRGGTTPANVINGATGQPYPLSFALLGQLQAQGLLSFETPSLSAPSLLGLATASSPTAVRGGFKTPGIRNVELTAPYFHNGSMDTLQQVVEFYARGGNFPNTADNPTLDAKMDPIGNLRVPGPDQVDMVNFLRSLTDARVREDLAPFDHPSLDLPGGDPSDAVVISLPATGGTPTIVSLQTFSLNTLPTATLSTAFVIGGAVRDDTPNNDAVNVEVDVNGLKSRAAVNRTPDDTWTFTLSTLAGLRVGANALSVTASTPTGATTTLPAAIDVLPTALVIGAPTGATKLASAVLTVRGAGVTTYRYKVDDGPYSAETSTADQIAISGLADGFHTVSVLGTAVVGTASYSQPEANPTLAQWTVKTTPPAITMNPTATPTRETTQVIGGVVDLGIIPRVSLDTAALAGPVTVVGGSGSATWSCEISGLKNGINNVTVTATDIAFNETSVTAAITVAFPDGSFTGAVRPGLIDAVKALRIAAGTEAATALDMLHGDVAPLVNGAPAPDGVITVEDALLILMKVARLINF